MEKTRRHCMLCGKSFHGRQDKKFCSDQCRATHHNQQLVTPRKTIRKINTILLRNRMILKQASHSGYMFIPKDQLQDWGFNFGYNTHMVRNKKGKQIICCYDKAYSIDTNGMVELIDPLKELSDIIPPPLLPNADRPAKYSPRPKR
jgi:predicted nucleic acid-binding Zn ribbon protein